MPSLETLGYAFLGGLVPALLWLYFLLKEDGKCPEPRWLVFFAFLAGMASVPLVIYPQAVTCAELASDPSVACPGTAYREITRETLGLGVIVAWATIEETVKYLLAAVFILWRRVVKQWTHLVTAMITVALGFAALENALFLIGPLAKQDLVESLITGNLRFIGTTLVHVVSSAAIGFALAFTYMKRPAIRAMGASIGLILAIALHALFNFLIIPANAHAASGADVLLAFFIAWTGTLAVLAAFEILKFYKYRRLPKNTC